MEGIATRAEAIASRLEAIRSHVFTIPFSYRPFLDAL